MWWFYAFEMSYFLKISSKIEFTYLLEKSNGMISKWAADTSFSQFLMFFNNGFWFYSMMGGWSTWQWVFLNSSINFWSFDTPDTPGCASAVFADNQSENEIWNRLKQFLPVCNVPYICKKFHEYVSNMINRFGRGSFPSSYRVHYLFSPSYFTCH